MVLHANYVAAAAETAIGFGEFKIGLIPTAGGTKELYLRALINGPDPAQSARSVFNSVVNANIMRNAFEAKKLGLIPQTAKITMDRDRLIEGARQLALCLISEKPLIPGRAEDQIPVGGQSAYQELIEGTEVADGHNELVRRKLAYVLTGGDLSHPSKVTEQHLLDLELEALMSLSGEASFEYRLQAALK
jgi:3-hydroxyacyl-CoA dehydrogenase